MRFDSLALSPEWETMLAMNVPRGGAPAPDLTPFLGVVGFAPFQVVLPH